MSIPATFFIPHEQYSMESAYTLETQKIMPADRLKGKILLVISVISVVASIALFSPLSTSAITVAGLLCAVSVVTLAFGIYFCTRKTKNSEIAPSQLSHKSIQKIKDIAINITGTSDNDESIKIGINLESLISRPEFRADPIKYLTEWKKARNQNNANSQFKLSEDNLLAYFDRPEIQNLLNEKSPELHKAFIPHQRYQWSITSNPMAPGLTIEQLCKLAEVIVLDKSEVGSNLVVILTDKNFIANPLDYIKKWKESRGNGGLFRVPEDVLLSNFTSDKVQIYLTSILPGA